MIRSPSWKRGSDDTVSSGAEQFTSKDYNDLVSGNLSNAKDLAHLNGNLLAVSPSDSIRASLLKSSLTPCVFIVGLNEYRSFVLARYLSTANVPRCVYWRKFGCSIVWTFTSLQSPPTIQITSCVEQFHNEVKNLHPSMNLQLIYNTTHTRAPPHQQFLEHPNGNGSTAGLRYPPFPTLLTPKITLSL